MVRALLLLLPLAAWAEKPLVGDGVTPAQLTFPAPRPPGDVDASAGTVRSARVAGNSLSIEFVPPRVSAPVTVTFSVRRRPVGSVAVTPPVRVPGERASGGRFDLRGPDALVLGVDRSAEISFRDAQAPTTRVNVGALTPPRRDSAGRWHTTYTPPQGRFPQTAIIAVADGDDGPLDTLTIPLHGQAQLDAASEPDARLEVQVADVRYGPVRTDAHGHARLVVLAPPGTPSGVARATDRAGNVSEKPLDLQVPPANRLLALCRGDQVAVIVVDPRGTLSDEAQVRLSATVGTPGAPRRLAPGVFVSTLEVRDDQPGAEAHVTAALADAPESTARCTLPLTSEWPSELRLTADRAAFVAGEGPIAVTAELRYPGRRTPREAPVELSADFGPMSAVRRASPTSFAAVWTPPAAFAGRVEAHLHARTLSGPPRTAELTLPLRAAAVAKLTLSPSARGRMHADGKSRVTIAVTARDAWDNTVPPERLTVRARGQATPVAGPAIEYVAPRDYAHFDDSVVVREEASHVETSVRVRLVPARHRFAAFAHVGYLTNFGKVSAPLVGGGLEARLPWLHSAFAIAVATGYYTSTDHLPSSGGEATSLSMWAVPLYAQLKYRLPLGRFGLEAAAGGGVLFPRLSFTSPAADPVSSSATVGLFTGGVAADADIRYGHVTVAVGYWYAPVAGDLHGNVGGLTITAGYGFDFL